MIVYTICYPIEVMIFLHFVGGEGLEPPVSMRIDLQSTRLPITGYPPNYICIPNGIRTRDSAVKGRRLRPLVDGNINLVGLQRFEL